MLTRCPLHGCQAPGNKACQGLPLGLSVGHTGSFREAWTPRSSGWLRMLITEGRNENAVDPTIITRGVFGISYLPEHPQSKSCVWMEYVSPEKRGGHL